MATAAASATGRETRALQRRRLPGLHLEDLLLEAITLAGADPDSGQIAHRVAGYLAGPPLPLWHYIVIDVRVPVPSLPLFDGWELTGIDRVNDLTLPINFPGSFNGLWSVDSMHDRGFGALRVPDAADTVNGGLSAQALLWPLMALNLREQPVRAFLAYQVEPGRRVVGGRGSSSSYLPTELEAWHSNPLSVLTFRSRLPELAVEGLSEFAGEIGSCVAALSDGDRRIFSRAAEHHLYLTYHQGKNQPELDGSYVAFRRTVAIEALLTAAERNHEGIARKVAQRAGMLAGDDDGGRLAVRDLIKAAYSARSAFAHGSDSTKQVDQEALKITTKVVMRRWLALAAIHGARKLMGLLDDALLASEVRDQLLQTITEHEHRAGIR